MTDRKMQKFPFKGILTLSEYIHSLATEIAIPGDKSKDILIKIIQKLTDSDKTQDKNAKELQKYLMDNLVFLVLNHTPLRDSENRDFVAAINWNKVDHFTKDYISSYSLSPYRIKSLEDTKKTCALLFYGGEIESENKKKAELLWLWKWKEYFDITLRAESNWGIHTWNQYLLKGCERPHIVGVSWSEDDIKNPLCKSINNNVAGFLCLPKPSYPNWIKELIDLPIESFENTGNINELNDFARLWDNMIPINQNSSINVPWVLFHLIRSYAIWGGKSFFSIPVTFGRYGKNRTTAVLSLCFFGSVKEQEIIYWKNLAWSIFNPLVAEEALEMKEQAERVYMFEVVGHAMKGAIDFTGYTGMLPELRKHIKLLDRSDLNKRKNMILLKKVETVLASFSYAHGLGHLVRLISIIGKKNDLEKIRSWVNLDSLSDWNNRDPNNKIISNYCDVLFAIAKIACMNLGWPKLEFVYSDKEGRDEIIKWDYSDDSNGDLIFNPEQMSLKPLDGSKSKEALLTLLPAIIEPILNAITAMHKERISQDIPLKLALSLNLPDFILLKIGNETFIEDIDIKTFKGIKHAEFFIKEAMLAEYLEPCFEPSPSGGKIVWISLKLYPNKLASYIIKEGSGQ